MKYLLALCILLSYCAYIDATHGRGASITWASQPDGTASIQLVSYWNATFWQVNFNFTMGDGSAPLPKRGVVVSRNSEYVTVIVAFTYKYPTPAPGKTSTYRVDVSHCCRISTLRSGKDENYRWQTSVKIGAVPRTSSSSNLPPIVTFGIGKNELLVPAIKPGSWSMSSSSVSGLSIPNFGTRASVAPISINSTGLLSWTTTMADVGLWSTQLKHDSLDGFIIVDFLIDVKPNYIDDQPPKISFDPVDQSYSVQPGKKVEFKVQCSTKQPGKVKIELPALYASDMGLQTVGQSTVDNLPSDGNDVPSSVTFLWNSATITNGGLFQDFVLPYVCTNLNNGLTDTNFVKVSVAAPLTITCPADAEVSCLSAPTTTATATHGCSGDIVISYADETVPSNCTGGAFKRTWTASNDCLQIVSCVQTLTVNDKVAPTITSAPQSTSVQCFEDSAPAGYLTPFASDNCDPNPSVSFKDKTTQLSSSCKNNLVRNFTATDACGNTAWVTQTISIDDTTAPTISPLVTYTSFECPEDVTPDAIVTDNCKNNNKKRVHSDLPKKCGPFTLSWTASDYCNNKVTKTMDITVSHTNPPSCWAAPQTVSCPADAKYVPQPECEGYCEDETEAVLSTTTPTLEGTCTKRITRTYSVTDFCGNQLSYDQVIPVNDNDAPTLSVPGDKLGEFGSDISTTALGLATANDACDGSLTPISADAVEAGSTNCLQRISRVWTATDSCGNVGTAVQHITLEDTTAPTYTAPADFVGQCPSELANTGVPTLSDINSPSYSHVDGTSSTSSSASCGNVQFVRTWTAVDSCGNSDDFFQTISIIDNQAPTLTVPSDVTVECAIKAIPANTGSASAQDNCDNSLIPTYTDDVQPNLIVRTWTVSDNCGNTATGVQKITLDNALPLLSVPADITVPCESQTGVAVTGKAVAADGCTGNLVPTFTDSRSGTCPVVITRTWTVSDANTGKSATQNQIITVGHPDGPTVNAPANTTVQCKFLTGTEYTGNATASDLCDEVVSVSYTDDVSPTAVLRSWSSTDSCGKTTTVVQEITIKDTTAPVLSIPPRGATACNIDVSISRNGYATATDNCDVPADITITNTDEIVINRGQCNSCPSLRRNWTAVDKSGNVAHAVQNIDVFAQPPTFNSSISSVRLYCEEELSSVAPFSAVDSCGNPANSSYSDSVNTVGCGFSIQRTWTATDDCGSSSTFVQAITIQDTIQPVLSSPSSAIVECEADIPVSGVVSASDNCVGVGSPYYSDYSRQDGCPIIIERRWYVKDACGNVADAAKQSITVRKVTKPTLVTPPDATLSCGDATTPDVTGTGAAEATDVCGNTLAVKSDDIITREKDGTTVIKRTWSTIDDCGNAVSKVQTIRITPDVPTVTAPADFVGFCNDDISPNNTGFPTYSVKCGTVDVTYYDPEDCPILGSFKRKWTVSRGGEIIYSGYQRITRANCLPEAVKIGNLTGEVGPLPYAVWPSVHIDDLDIPCESVTIVWIWGDGSNSTQICDVSAPCSGCNFNGKGLDASYEHTYNYPGTYSVQVFAYDSRATLPSPIPKAPSGFPISGDGWISLTYEFISVYDPSAGSVSGTANFFSYESYAPGVDELAGNAVLVFGAKFNQVGVSLTATGQTIFAVGNGFVFFSSSYTHLTVVPATTTEAAHAVITGQGSLNGNSGYSFYLFALASGSSDDRVRIQISDPSNVVVYDSFLGKPADVDTIPDPLPQAHDVSVLISNPPPSTVSALQEDSASASAFNASTAPYIVAMIVLGVLLVLTVTVGVVLFLRLKAATATASQGDNFQKL